jgi:PASTA domain
LRTPWTCVAALAVVALTAIGCGSSETVTVTEEAATPPPQTVTQRAEPAPKKKSSPPSPAQPNDEASEGDTATVPDLVGVDHQLAQDTLQAAGFYLIDETDCSGDDRLLLWDRNWVVVEQDPPGGATASMDDTITLCSLKDDEQ